MTGQNIEIKNSDPTNHNIHPLPKVNQEWNESQPPGGEPKMQHLRPRRSDPPIPVKCNVHPWMRSYIAVVEHPFFAVTGDDGSFTIKGLPPGTYTLTAWHEKYGDEGHAGNRGGQGQQDGRFLVRAVMLRTTSAISNRINCEAVDYR